MNFVPRIAWGVLLCGMVLSAASRTQAQEEKQIGSVEIAKLTTGRYARLANDVDETAMRGFLQMIAAPKGSSFVVLWMDLKLTTGKDDDGDPVVRIPEPLVKLQGEDGTPFVVVGNCTRDGRFETSYGYGYSYYGMTEKETTPYSLVYLVPDGVKKLKLTMGTAVQEFDAPEKIEPTIDRAAAAIFKIAKIEVVDGINNKQRLGSYSNPAGDALLSVEGTTSKFVVIQLYIKGKESNNSNGGFQFQSGDLGVLFGAEVFAQPIGMIDSDGFEPGYTYINSEQDVIGDFSTAAVKLVFPLPGRITKFKLLYLMQPIGEIDVPK